MEERIGMKDSNGRSIKVGDILVSSYGIPPKRIEGEVIKTNDDGFWIYAKGHRPEYARPRVFKKHLGYIEIKETNND